MTDIPKNQKILFFCAHPDDDTFSSGALIYSLVKNNNKVVCIYLTSSPRGVQKIFQVKKKYELGKQKQ